MATATLLTIPTYNLSLSLSPAEVQWLCTAMTNPIMVAGTDNPEVRSAIFNALHQVASGTQA